MVSLGMLTLTAASLNHEYFLISTIVAGDFASFDNCSFFFPLCSGVICILLSLPFIIYFPEPPSGHHKVRTVSDMGEEMLESLKSIYENKEMMKMVSLQR